ncbi:LEA type 2 family protein [Haloprofundus salilacus]|uniref:LEA type 2 family protein n=1 Tax=Haloprofundus salilacus TaxID=2876190 RepID=UPI001CCB2704|nr:LEA type 2 family protein [Haloprofundus salilacus]
MDLSGLRALALGSRLRVAATAIVALAVVVVGAVALGVVGTPSVVDIDNRFAGVNNETTTIETNMTVNNPNPIGVHIADLTVDYQVSMNDVRMAGGSREGIRVDRGNTTLDFRTQMRNEKIPAWWASHIENDERTTLRIDADAHWSTVNRTFDAPTVEREIETDLISSFNSSETRPVDANQPVVSDPVAYINQTNATWGNVNESQTPLDLTFVTYNPKSYPVAVTEVGYTITMNDVQVGEGSTDREYVMQPKRTQAIETRAFIDNSRLDEWWVTHLQRNEVTELRIDFYAVIRVTSGTTVRVPLDAITYTETIETDMFDNKPDGESATDSSATDDSTGGGNSTRTADGTATATTTAGADTAAPSGTSTATETPGGNETTDGGGLLSETGLFS